MPVVLGVAHMNLFTKAVWYIANLDETWRIGNDVETTRTIPIPREVGCKGGIPPNRRDKSNSPNV